ncbi:RNA polymerase subunit sigma-70 [Aquipuribacter sp. MA13-6]|uniref:RNA polymerase subunit sigma-70 n=1 Tax=unclassified Aquipuribacter TaxID=2635084 RepID=UPI003EEBF837
MASTVQVPAPDDPEAAFAAVIALRRVAARLEAESVAHAVTSGWTWAEIGQALGISAQAVHKRFAAQLRQQASGRRPSTSRETR